MTTTRAADLPVAVAQATTFCLPDIPQKHPDDMTSVASLHQHGALANIIQYLGHPDTAIVSGERYIVPGPAHVANESRYPDLLVAFDVDPAAYLKRAMATSCRSRARRRTSSWRWHRGAPPATTWREKKDYYEGLGVGEYWLFDSVGEFYGFTLAGLPTGRRPLPAHRGA